MHIQSIGALPANKSCNAKKSKINSNRTNFNANQTSFKSYNDTMISILGKDLETRIDVARCNSKLIQALINEPGIQKTSAYEGLKERIENGITFLVEELCKPNTQMKPELINVIYESRNHTLPLIKLNGKDALFIRNNGKFGFINDFLGRDSAKNDMEVIYLSDAGYFSIGMNSVGDFKVYQQFFHSDVYQHNLYENAVPGRRLYRKVARAEESLF